MFRSIFTKTLRDYRVAILGWGLGVALGVYTQFAAIPSVFSTPESRASAVAVAQSFRFFGEPIAVDTPAGYVTWKTIGFLPLLVGIWAALAGSRLARGAEERGTLDIILSAPRSRARVLGEGIAALTTALALIGILIGLGAIGGGAAAKEPVAAGAALLAGLNVGLMSLLIGLFALLLSQFMARAGAAAGAAVGLAVLAWMVDGAGRVIPNGAWISRLSPYHLYIVSKPLIASVGTNWAALLTLAVLCAICGVASVALFDRRDLGGTVWSRRGAARRPDDERALAGAARDTSLRGILPRTLWADASTIAWWLLGPGLLVVGAVGVVRATKDQLATMIGNSPLFKELLGGSDATFLSGILFLFLPALILVYALVLAESWARELDAGRFELLLGTPTPRWRVFLGAWGATCVALVLAPLVLWVVALVSIRGWGLQVAAGDTFAAFAGFLPLELLVAALVYLVAGRLSAGAITGAIGGLIALSFLADFLNPVLKLPGWLVGLSVFHQYGTPIVSGPRWGAWLALIALAAVFLALGLVRFTRADLARGS